MAEINLQSGVKISKGGASNTRFGLTAAQHGGAFREDPGVENWYRFSHLSGGSLAFDREEEVLRNDLDQIVKTLVNREEMILTLNFQQTDAATLNALAYLENEFFPVFIPLPISEEGPGGEAKIQGIGLPKVTVERSNRSLAFSNQTRTLEVSFRASKDDNGILYVIEDVLRDDDTGWPASLAAYLLSAFDPGV